MELVVGITGASGSIYGLRLLEVLKDLGIRTHLIISAWAARTIALEIKRPLEEVRQMAWRWYDEGDMAAPVSSGSYKTAGMAVVPCSMKTLAGIAHGFSHNLIARAADVMLKERRRLILVPRETPLSLVHLQNMLRAAQAGAIIMPPNPAFYLNPRGIEDIVDHFVGRLLDAFGIEHGLSGRWEGDS